MTKKTLSERIDEACDNCDGAGFYAVRGGDGYSETFSCSNRLHALAREVDEALLMARGAQSNAEGLLAEAKERLAAAKAALMEAPEPLHRGPVETLHERVYRLWFDGQRAEAMKP